MRDSSSFKVTGEYQDIIRHADGRVEVMPVNHNLVVDGFNVLVAALLKKDAAYSNSIYWCIGDGEDDWDTPPSYAQVVIAVTSGATSSGNITITLAGTAKLVPVTAGMTAAEVAAAIRAFTFTGWTTSGSDASATITCNTAETKTASSFSAGSTGVVATLTNADLGAAAITRPDPAATDTGCVHEIARKAVSSSRYLDGSGNTSETPTNVLELSTIFNAADAVGNWREFSLMGGNSTASLNSGIAINHKTHGLIAKTNTMEIERKIKFTISQYRG